MLVAVVVVQELLCLLVPAAPNLLHLVCRYPDQHLTLAQLVLWVFHLHPRLLQMHLYD
jgi:hypothetical protein